MSDLIDRKAAIDAILAVTGNSSVRELYEHVQEHGLSDMWSGGVSAAIDIIIAVPSAQSVAKDTNVPINDCISRQAAIDAVKHAWAKGLEPLQYIEELPSAQPEIIRCKDCKYADDDCVCQHSMGLVIQDDDDYCSYAERRTDGRD